MSVTVKVTADYKGEEEKSSIVRALPRAFFKQAEDWAAGTVRYIKESYKGGRVFKNPPKEFDARLGHVVRRAGEERAQIILGTGRHIGRDEVVYARIHEEGGWIVPKKRKYLAIPWPGVKNSPAQYRGMSFVFKSKRGNLLIGMTVGKRKRLKPLFTLAENAKLPARHWFTRPIAERMPVLEQMMSAEGIWARAAQMKYKRTAAQGGKA